MTTKQTPSQTIGPFFAYGLTSEQYDYPLKQIAGGNLLAPAPETLGEHITIVGRLFDSNGEVVDDAMIEIWQADADGRYAHSADKRGNNSGFTGFGRFGTGTDPQNRFVFETVKPGSPDGIQAPHISVCIFARGLLSHLYTRIYFSDASAENAADPILQSVPEGRRATLIAQRDDSHDGLTYQFNIHLCGDAETVFFDV